MLFRVDEILLLENITYFTNEAPLRDVLNSKGITVREMMNSISLEDLIPEKQYATFMNGKDFYNLITAIKKNEALMDCLVLDSHLDEGYGGGGGVSAVFLNIKNREAVVAYRGTADNEWEDDMVGANVTDSLQQVNALEWYRKVYNHFHLEKYTVTITGHSKGGNKAKYITILEDSVTRCISFDGQGFSDKFIEFYHDRIVERQSVIKNHNVDYDYVNILLNDIGEKTYYIGYDYGEGGFAEAHCPNTFFDFKEDSSYEMRINPSGQAPEMQILDQFINSMVRSAVSEKEKSETNVVVGQLVEKAFQIGVTMTTKDFISFFCDFVGDPQYSDNIAYLIVFCIKYSKSNPLLDAFQSILIHFHMEELIHVIELANDIVNSKKINAVLDLGSFLVLHANGLVVKKVQSVAKKKYDLDLTKDQIKKVLTIISLANKMMDTLVLDENGSDIIIEEAPKEEEPEVFDIPENLDVVVLAGGLSNERNVSLITGFAVKEALESKGHNVIILDAYLGYGDEEMLIDDPFANPEEYNFESGTIEMDIADIWAVKKRRTNKSDAFFGPNVISICRKADVVFLALKGASGENGKVQAALDLLGIDYTGCNSFSSGITLNKAIAKLVMTSHDIPVPAGFTVRKEYAVPNPKEYHMDYPLIIKPCNGGYGIGVSVVNDKRAYDQAIAVAFKWENELVVEEYITGRQFAVSTLDGKALPVIEVLPLKTTKKDVGLSIAGRQVKKCPAEIPAELAETLQQTALDAAKALGINGYSLTDFIVRADGSFVCLECDTLPELTDSSLFVMEAEAAGISFPDLCEKIIELSLKER